MIKLSNIVKKFFCGQPNELTVLKGINLSIKEGEFVSIVGQSGSGKSTLMNIIGALDKPTEGDYLLNNISTATLTDDELSQIRNRQIGFIFQNFNLIARSTALSNVELPMLYKGIDKETRTKRAIELLKIVEMDNRLDHLPNELSGGQKQRIAIARALANDPPILLADEPTGALDVKTGNLVMDIFKRINREEKKTVIIITHSQQLALETDRIITLRDGLIIRDFLNNKDKLKKVIL